MPTVLVPPRRRSDLVLRPSGNEGRLVVKDPRGGQYFTLEPQESFLLESLDGDRSTDEIRSAFRQRFGEELPTEDLFQFLEVAQEQGLLELPHQPVETPGEPASPPGNSVPKTAPPTAAVSPGLRGRMSGLLFWRRSLFDPDRLLTWLTPRLSFFWTPHFLVLSLFAVAWAGFLLAAHWAEFVGNMLDAFSLEILILAYLVVGLATLCHEFAHGMTCKRYGGDVHEIGFLLMFFLPCFYCNVSDAWLFREKSKRLWVTLAGGYCDLCFWALGVFFWRLTLPGTLPYHLAWVVVSVCGLRVLFNFFPLFKLDGYYLLSDLVEVPNLRQRSLDFLAERVRWLLWGTPRPRPEPRGKVLLAFGLAAWSFTLFYLGWMLFTLFEFAVWGLGPLGAVPVGILAWTLSPALFPGFFRGEFTAMLLQRHRRTVVWLGILAGLAALLLFVPAPRQATGQFKVRPARRAEIRAQVSGFLRVVYLEEGSRVSGDSPIACLEVPDLASNLTRKAAEVREAEARLRLLEAGSRPEEIREQSLKVERARRWHQLARQDLERRRQALAEELDRLQKQIDQAKVQFQFAAEALDRGRKLLDRQALSLDHFRDLEKDFRITKDRWDQAAAQKKEREVLGTLEQETELARREKDLADAVSALALLEVGTRPEEIQAEKARLARLIEERSFLEKMQERIRLVSPVGGVVITPRLREKIGHHFKEGELICEVEEPESLEAEIPLEEQEVSRVQPGQEVVFKARALPYTTFSGVVDRLAEQATPGKVQSTLTITCRLVDPPEDLRSGMTGYARIRCGTCNLGGYLFHNLFRYLRTEYWW